MLEWQNKLSQCESDTFHLLGSAPGEDHSMSVLHRQGQHIKDSVLVQLLGMQSLKWSASLLCMTSVLQSLPARSALDRGASCIMGGNWLGARREETGRKGRVSGTTCSWVERMPVGSSLRQAGLSQVATMQHTMKC